MKNQSIIIADKVPEFFIQAIEKASFKMTYQPDISQKRLREVLPDFTHLLVRGKHDLGHEEFSKAENLQKVLRPGAGIDNIDQVAAAENGVEIITSPEGNRDAVGEYATGMLLTLIKRTTPAMENVLDGKWSRYDYTGEELASQTVGIIGFGNTGSAFAEKLQGFGCRILAYDAYQEIKSAGVESVSLEELLSKSTVISFHLPLNEETKYYFNADFLQKLKHPVWLINTSRGGIVNLSDLKEGLKTGKIRGAVLDVLENENDEKKRRAATEFLKTETEQGRVLLTPHIAGLTEQSQEKIFSILLQKLHITRSC